MPLHHAGAGTGRANDGLIVREDTQESFRTWFSDVPITGVKGRLAAADLTNRKTDEANHNGRPLEQILSAFRASRQKLLMRVDEFGASLFARRVIPHPRLKTPMRLVDHLYFVAEHDDHHLARIWESLNRRDTGLA